MLTRSSGGRIRIAETSDGYLVNTAFRMTRQAVDDIARREE